MHSICTIFAKETKIIRTMTFNYDVIVVGAGHAGCEAAAAAANLGSKTLLITMDMNKIAQMSCNPAVGGIAKGQIVREIDALGGYMGIVTDHTAIQFRMLNKSKGPAMWSPRSQSDRARFIECWRGILENLPNLYIWQDTVRELLLDGDTVCGVKTYMNVEFRAKSVVLTNGTFLNGLLHRVNMKSMRNTACIRGSKHFQCFRLGCCGKGKEGQVRQPTMCSHFFCDFILAVGLLALFLGLLIRNLLELFFLR